jgi:protein subunit release factor A
MGWRWWKGGDVTSRERTYKYVQNRVGVLRLSLQVHLG